MISIRSNIPAMVALRILQASKAEEIVVRSRLASGLRVAQAKDNPSYWSTATALSSEQKTLAVVETALRTSAATIDVATFGLNRSADVLSEIRSRVVMAASDDVDRAQLQTEIDQLQAELVSIAGTSTFAGQNWLSVNSDAPDYKAARTVVSSVSRDQSGSIGTGPSDIDLSGIALFDATGGPVKTGILDQALPLRSADGSRLSLTAPFGSGGALLGGLSSSSATGSNGGTAGTGGALLGGLAAGASSGAGSTPGTGGMHLGGLGAGSSLGSDSTRGTAGALLGGLAAGSGSGAYAVTGSPISAGGADLGLNLSPGARSTRTYGGAGLGYYLTIALIPTSSDQNRCAQSRMPIEMIFQD